MNAPVRRMMNVLTVAERFNKTHQRSDFCTGFSDVVIALVNQLKITICPIKEARYLLSDGRRPGDTVVPFGEDGLPVAYDLVVTSALRPDILQRCTHEPQYAAQVGRDRKLSNIGNQAREAGFSFKALSCTSFGFWDPVAEREIVKLCRAKSTRLGLSESKVVSSEFRLLSCALMRGLASMILNRDLHCDDHYNESLCDFINP